jgi:hypothetical protein
MDILHIINLSKQQNPIVHSLKALIVNQAAKIGVYAYISIINKIRVLIHQSNNLELQ